MRGFTLMEVLAVVVLLALGASVATMSLAGASDAATAESAISIIRDADARARLLAGRGQAVSIQANHAAFLVTAADGERRVFELPAGLRVHLLNSQERELGSVQFDARGRSPDYAVLAGRDDDRWLVRVAGLTGWTRVEREARP